MKKLKQIKIEFPKEREPGRKANYPENVAWSQEYQNYIDKQEQIWKSKIMNPQWVWRKLSKREKNENYVNGLFAQWRIEAKKKDAQGN